MAALATIPHGNVVNGATNTEQDMLYGEIGNDTPYGDGYDADMAGRATIFARAPGTAGTRQEMTRRRFWKTAPCVVWWWAVTDPLLQTAA